MGSFPVQKRPRVCRAGYVVFLFPLRHGVLMFQAKRVPSPPRHIRLFPFAIVILGIFTTSASAEVDFLKDIRPLLSQHCLKCHGEKKGLGKLRLHTLAVIRAKMDVDEDFLVSSEPDKSEIYQRLVLPKDHKKRMPKGADPLPEEQIELIRNWIEQGAQLPDSITDTDSVKQEQTKRSELAERPEAPLPEVQSAPSEAIEQLVASGAQVQSVFAGSHLLQVSFALRETPATDADVALLEKLSEQVLSLNLAGAQITDSGFAPLAKLKHLRKLHLERSSISDAGLEHLVSLASLEYLNLYGTEVTDAGLEQLGKLPTLRRLYLWRAPVSYDVAMALRENNPGLTVNLGHDHPEILRQNLTKELAQLEEQVQSGKKELADAQQRLKQAESRLQKTKERRSEVEKSLKALTKATDTSEQ